MEATIGTMDFKPGVLFLLLLVLLVLEYRGFALLILGCVIGVGAADVLWPQLLATVPAWHCR